MKLDTQGDDIGEKVARFKRHARPLLAVIVAGAVGYSGYGLYQQWEGESLTFDRLTFSWPGFGLAAVSMTLATALQGAAWIALIEHLAKRRIERGAALALYFDSQMARYTPGKIGLPLVRVAGAAALGVARRTTLLSVLVEMLSWTGVGGAVALALFALRGAETGLGGSIGRVLPALVALAAAGVLLLTFLDRRHLPRAFGRVLNLEGEGTLMPPSVPLIHLVYWLLWALHGFAISLTFGAAPEGALRGVGFYVLAPVVGFLALVAPAGVGVREAVLLGLAPVVGAKIALSAALTSRVVTLATDVLVWLAARALVRRRAQAD